MLSSEYNVVKQLGANEPDISLKIPKTEWKGKGILELPLQDVQKHNFK